MKIIKYLTISFLCCVANLAAYNISGIVSNQSNGQSIEYVSVIVKETQQGSYTNNKGYFVITNVSSGAYTLVVSHVAFKVKEIPLTVGNKNEYLKIELVTQSIVLEDIKVRSKGEIPEVNTREIVVSQIPISTEQLLDVVQVAEPDIFRAIMTLPGVVPIADFSAGLYVRGGSPDQNQSLLDDTDVYNPSHFGGLFSTFNTDAVDNVNLIKGGFPAKYGGRLSSVLDVRNRDGNRKEHQGVARLSLISLSGTLEGPWKIGSESGSYMGSFRRSYLDLMRKMNDIIPDYHFYDGHAKLNWDIGNLDKLTVSTYFGYDKLDMDMDFGFNVLLGWGNNTFSSQWMHIFSPQLFSNFVLSYSNFRSIMEQKSGDDMYRRKNSLDDITFKGMLSYQPTNEHLLEFGIETKHNGVSFINEAEMDIEDDNLPKVVSASLTSDLYVQDSWKIDDNWTFQPGVRFTNYSTLDINLKSAENADYWQWSPRASLRRKLSLNSNVYASYGRYYQFLNLISPGISTPLDIWVPIDGTIPPAVADHYILGYKHEIMQGLGIDLEVYYKNMKNLVEYNRDIDEEFSNETTKLSDLFHLGKGDAKGLDFLVRTDKWGWQGFLGYAYGITRRKMEGMNQNPLTGVAEYYYPKYDRSHQFNAVQTFNMTEQFGWSWGGSELKLGLTYSYSTGQPERKPEKVYFGADHLTFLYSYSDAVRLPPYSRLDMSFKMLWQNEHYSIEPYLQAINVTDRKNVYSRSYYIDENFALQHEDFTQFPLIPFLGVNIYW
jgi:outer membrane receptor protein involved in Fe transport